MKLSENAVKLKKNIVLSLPSDRFPKEEEILLIGTQFRSLPMFLVEDDEFNFLIKEIHAETGIDMQLGTKVVADHFPWVKARSSKIDPFYWDRYQKYLLKDGWSPLIANKLSDITEDILDLCGDPSGFEGWPRRGLVIGDVQSGKTATYTGLICKASDAGYKLVILLTGTLESLRKQTQERLDSGFVGLDSSGLLSKTTNRKAIGVGMIDGRKSPTVFTSTKADFKEAIVNSLGLKLQNLNEPVLLVVKKNPNILSNLKNWLVEYNADNEGKISFPLLLIDDEADNASINTSQNRVTTINGSIRTLLSVFPRSTYIGFTATPFANVFIHPESTDEMYGDDLFPKDFVYTLSPPDNYIGAKKLFFDNIYDFHCEIDDAEAIFPPRHKMNLVIDSLPESLLVAIRQFLLVNTILDLRGGDVLHRSMLVNVTHYTDTQNTVRDLIDEYFKSIRSAIRGYASLSDSAASKNNHLSLLKETFDKYFSVCGLKWIDIQITLFEAVTPIEVLSVNRSSLKGLQYTENSKYGYRVIAVGGNSLSRGITLEGLCISYFYRQTSMYDALLQMGRWFGYRKGYDDLVRIWMTNDMYDSYVHITEASEELRSATKRMQNLRLKPIDFGMKVRSHPDALLMITARNKMKNTEELITFINVSEEAFETSKLPLDSGHNALISNFTLAKNLVRNLVKDGKKDSSLSGGETLWTAVPKSQIATLLRNFQVNPLNLNFDPVSLAEFVEFTEESAMQSWDVYIPSGKGELTLIDESLEIRLQERFSIWDKDRSLLAINGKKARVGSRGAEKAGLTQDQIQIAEDLFWQDVENKDAKSVSDAAYRRVRERPLLILHFLSVKLGESELFNVKDHAIVTALGLSFPRLNEVTKRVKYRVNLVEVRNLLAEEPTDSDDVDEFENDI